MRPGEYRDDLIDGLASFTTESRTIAKQAAIARLSPTQQFVHNVVERIEREKQAILSYGRERGWRRCFRGGGE
jgi:hypothetical protein